MVHSSKALLGLLASLAFVVAEEYVCPEGKSSTSISVGAEEAFSFFTQDGDQYTSNVNCQVKYEMDATCKQLLFDCEEFNLGKGDMLGVSVQTKKGVKTRRFRKKKFKVQKSNGDITVQFKSNKKKNGAGAVCFVECSKAASGVTTTSGPGSSSASTEAPTTTTGLLITGGDLSFRSVELFDINSRESCLLSELPDKRFGHTMNKQMICGGNLETVGVTSGSNFSDCLEFYEGSWRSSQTLQDVRKHHNSWLMEDGRVLLMGGTESSNTSELVTTNNVMESFPLNYLTIFACSITDEDTNTVIITGGQYAMAIVSRYNTAGFVEDLPSLSTGRYLHGCGQFVDSSNEKSYIVTGGWDSENDAITSTEKFSMGSWKYIESLPDAVFALRGVSLPNEIIMTGGRNASHFNTNMMLSFDTSTEKWSTIGTLIDERSYHAVSLVDFNQFKDYCY